MARPTRWDANVFARAAAAGLLALALAWLVTAATDEGGVPWGERVGRTLPLAPLCSAIGAWAALAQVRARGEALALAALGRSEAQIAGAAVVGGAVVAVGAAAAIGALRSIDVAGFYPIAAHSTGWQWRAGVFVDATQGLVVAADGSATRLAGVEWARGGDAIPSHGRLAASIATAIAGLALPLVVGRGVLTARSGADGSGNYRGASWVPWAAACAIQVAASIALFQASAARRLPALLAVTPAVLLLGFTVWSYRRST